MWFNRAREHSRVFSEQTCALTQEWPLQVASYFKESSNFRRANASRIVRQSSGRKHHRRNCRGNHGVRQRGECTRRSRDGTCQVNRGACRVT